MRHAGILLYVPVLAAAALAAFPVFYLLFGSVWTEPPGFPGTFTARNFEAVFADPTIWTVLWNSIVYAAGSAILATVVAIFLSVAVNKTDAPFKKLVVYSLLVTLAVPWMVEDMAWTYLLAPRTGLYNLWLSAIPGLGNSFLNVYSIWGLVFVMGLSLTPLAYLIVSPSLSLVDPRLEEASMVSGADLKSTFRRVDLPLVRPAALSASLLCFVIAMEAFDAAAIIGIPGKVGLLTTAIYAALQGFSPDPNLASAYAVLLVVLTTTALALFARSVRASQRYQTVTGRSGARKTFRLGRWRWLIGAALLAYVLGYPVPVLGMLAFVSLHVYWNPTSLPPLTLYNYSQLLSFPALTGGIENSIIVSAVAAAATIGLACFLAYSSVRRSGTFRRSVELLAFIPLAFPTMVLGVGLLWALAYSPLPLYGTVWALVIAYTVRYVPIASRFLTGPMLQVGRELEEMSRVCGASQFQSLRKVFVPILKPSILAAGLYVFIVSIKDLGAAVMLITSSSTLFSAALYTIWSSGETLQAAAGGVVYVGVLASILAISAVALKVNLFEVLGAEARPGLPKSPRKEKGQPAP